MAFAPIKWLQVTYTKFVIIVTHNCNDRVSQKFVPLISCVITFDQNFILA